MSTTIDDVSTEVYFEEMHDSYTRALEDFASSRNIRQLKENLEKLEIAAENAESEKNISSKDLHAILEDTKTLKSIYQELVEARVSGNKRFVLGTILTIIGIVLTVLGVILTVFPLIAR